MANLSVFHCVAFIPMIAISLMHFIFFFMFKITEFNNIFNSLDSSPFFNFHLDGNNCGADEYITFHTWGGIKEKHTHSYYRNGKRHHSTEIVIVGKSEINKINGRYFCYKKGMTYKQLLYNNQIIKKNETCKDGYKNCGIIDTLEQQLCMPQDDECPLYDVGIEEGNNYYKDNVDYTYDEASRIYYNKNTYNEPNKKIIGKIVLNDGNPCYDSNEQKWRTFILKEADDNHLTCELKIFDKNSDDRYTKIGDISYYMIYRDNIDYKYFSLFPKQDIKSRHLSLYKIEFFGIDKECDEKSEEFKIGYDKIKKIQNSEKLLLLIEPILSIAGFVFVFIVLRFSDDKTFIFILILYESLFGVCIICHAIFLSQIIHNDLPPYECSDEITNEVSRQQSLNTKDTIIFTALNLAGDILVILINIFAFINFKYGIDWNKVCDFILCKNCKIYKEEAMDNNMRDVYINNNKNNNDGIKHLNFSNNKFYIYTDKKFNSQKNNENNSGQNISQDLNKPIDSKSNL